MLSSALCPVYVTLKALLALYGDNSTIPIESPIYGYIGCIRANYEDYTDKDRDSLGIMVCNKLRQPQNYIEAVDPDSVEMKTAELLSGIDGTMMFRYNSKDTFQALYVYLSEYHSGKRVSHKRVLELSYEDVKSAKNGLIVITPDFDNFTAKLIAADEYSKYMTETPILEGVANREYYGRSATSIENKSTKEYGTEQGLAALIYGEQGVSSLPIQDITGEYIDTDNEYMYYYSAEFVKQE